MVSSTELYRAGEVADRLLPDVLLKEGHLGSPTAPHARHHLQERLVHGASDP